MKKEKVWFNWHCPHCKHRNRASFPFQFEMPKYYSVIWECAKCSNKSKVEWNLNVDGWWQKKKPPKMRKRIKVEKKRKREESGEGQGDSQVYRNDQVREASGIK